MAQGQLEAARTLGFEIRNPQRFAHNIAQLARRRVRRPASSCSPVRASRPNSLCMMISLRPLGALAQAPTSLVEAALQGIRGPGHALEQLFRPVAFLRVPVHGTGRMDARGLLDISAPQDPRFQHPAWSEHPYFDFLKQSYLITSHWADTLVNGVEDLDPHTRNKARFYRPRS